MNTNEHLVVTTDTNARLRFLVSDPASMDRFATPRTVTRWGCDGAWLLAWGGDTPAPQHRSLSAYWMPASGTSSRWARLRVWLHAKT